MTKADLLKKMTDSANRAHAMYQELKAKLAADTTGPKVGDIYIVKPGTYPVPVDEETEAVLDTEWVVVHVHPDDAGLVLVLPYDSMSRMNGPLDVLVSGNLKYNNGDTITEGIIRCNAMTWIRSDFLTSVARRFAYVELEYVHAAQKIIGKMATGQPVEGPAGYEDEPEYEEREAQVWMMSHGLSEAEERAAAN